MALRKHSSASLTAPLETRDLRLGACLEEGPVSSLQPLASAALSVDTAPPRDGVPPAFEQPPEPQLLRRALLLPALLCHTPQLSQPKIQFKRDIKLCRRNSLSHTHSLQGLRVTHPTGLRMTCRALRHALQQRIVKIDNSGPTRL
jgi:hypothetical protein